MSDNLKGKMVDALTWTSVDRFGQQGVQFIIGLIYARLLMPEEFGLIGLVMVFIAISYVFIESGFTQALIRKKNANDTDYSTIFFFNISVSTLLYLVLFLAAPLIAQVFGQPELISISRVVFLVLIFNSLCLVPTTILTKALNFKTIAKVNIIALIISGSMGVFMAWKGYGVWALVIQQILFVVFRWINFSLFLRWMPKWEFQFAIIREFAGFSIHLLGTGLLNAVFNNLFLFVMGIFYPIKQVGYYTQGNKLSETFNYSIQSVLSASTYPLFAKIHDEHERLLRIYRDIIKKTAFVVLPVLFSLIVVAEPLIRVLLTTKFLDSVPYFQILLLAAVFVPFYMMNINLLNSRGKSKLTFRIEIVKKSLILLAVVFCFKFGIFIMLCGYAIANFISFLISLFYIKAELKYYFRHQFLDMYTSIIIAATIALSGWLLHFFIHNSPVLLASQIALCAVMYIVAMRLFYKSFYTEIWGFILKKIQSLKK